MSENDNVKVRVRNLTKCFGDLKVLDNVSFDIQKGDFVCIVGPTGCGKTTFLKCLVRLFSLTEGRSSWTGNRRTQTNTTSASSSRTPRTCPG